ncbi:ComF family protein [Aureimonas sp. AU20]|uniref:ComF family protein n=1 Tax=Aureimonas sp. AU20 TaxID=1349819 RepID=UPI00072227DD|nr:ComF family protein [Aureimonas sp. AU20]ALN74334.1 hypothetical protein M673_16525 [Aureimonas sp. AU20]
MVPMLRGWTLVQRSLTRFLYPPVCPGCGVAVGEAAALCPICWRGMRFIERPYCEALGLPFSFNLGKGFLSAEAIAEPPAFARLRAAVIYEDLAARLVSRLKYGDRTDLAPLMAGWMRRAGAELLADAEVIVPVPLHRTRLFRRRFNQSAELARLLANGHPPFAPMALRRTRRTRSQVGLGPAERLANVRGAFEVPAREVGAVSGRRVLLVDDVFTTGATVSSAVRALKRAGAREVDVLVFARVAAGRA